MASFVIINSTYENVQVALYLGDSFIEQQQIHKHSASKNLIPLINDLLKKHSCILSDLDFIGINKGPGPFTTLRTVITTVNGISFATGIPLIGINGLDAFLQEYKNADYPNTVILLNAFGNDVYFATNGKQGYKNIDLLLQELKNNSNQEPIRFLGNGTELYEQKIKDSFGLLAIIPKPLALHCSIKQIANMALKNWQQQIDITQQIVPLYIKEQQFNK